MAISAQLQRAVVAHSREELAATQWLGRLRQSHQRRLYAQDSQEGERRLLEGESKTSLNGNVECKANMGRF